MNEVSQFANESMAATYNRTWDKWCVETNAIAIQLPIHFFKVDVCNQNGSGLLCRTKDAITSVMTANPWTQHALCQSVDVGHHQMEGTGATLSNVVERVDVSLVNVKVCVHRKFQWVMLSQTPFMNGGIELADSQHWAI
jgi:hypothetical protein